MSEMIKCDVCGKEYCKIGLKTHRWRTHTEAGRNFSPNSGKRSNSNVEKVLCDICGKECCKIGITQHKWRAHTEDGKKFSPNSGYVKGTRVTWNKGLTAKTNDSLKRASETLTNRYKSGELTGSMLGKHHSQETKDKLSKIRIDYLTEHPEMVPYKLNHYSNGKSYPETYWMGILDANNIEYTDEHRIGLYSLDFAILDKKIDLEIDGDQHHLDERIAKSDIRRTEYLESLGWRVIRVKWSEYRKLSKDCRVEFVDRLIKELGL